MRVLWIVARASLYAAADGAARHEYNGGGWIASAQRLLMGVPGITLGVCFPMLCPPEKSVHDGVTYYPFAPVKKDSLWVRLWCSVLRRYALNCEEQQWEYYSHVFLRVLDDFHPDLIHVFGSEDVKGLVARVTAIPVVLHIQGVLNPCFNAYLPPGMSLSEYVGYGRGLRAKVGRFLAKGSRVRSAHRERTILRAVQYYMGRTTWDERVTQVFHPGAKYFFCNEVLRDVFYESAPRCLPARLTIVTTISPPPYKGFDLVLKTAKVLTEHLCADFVWYVYGVSSLEDMERFCHLRCADVGVKLMGVVDAEELSRAERHATVYVQPSYIENSPNSLCEAQLLGVTCIATAVGGIPSLIRDGETGYLVPANDPYQLAFLIHHLYHSPSLNLRLGLAAQEVARARHDRQRVQERIVEIYKEILG